MGLGLQYIIKHSFPSLRPPHMSNITYSWVSNISVILLLSFLHKEAWNINCFISHFRIFNIFFPFLWAAYLLCDFCLFSQLSEREATIKFLQIIYKLYSNPHVQMILSLIYKIILLEASEWTSIGNIVFHLLIFLSNMCLLERKNRTGEIGLQNLCQLGRQHGYNRAPWFISVNLGYWKKTRKVRMKRFGCC